MSPLDALAAAYAQEHPADVALCLASAPAAEAGAFLGELGAHSAARVLECASPTSAAAALAAMPPEAAAEALATLEPASAAALLRRVPDSELGAIRTALPQRVARQVDALMEYPVGTAGSRIDPRAPAVAPDTTVEATLQAVRAAAGGALNYVYVVERQQLRGVVSMRELMLARPDAPLHEVMRPNPHSMNADDPVEAILRHPGWRRAHAMPVVDAAGRFLGVIRHSQFRAIESELAEDETQLTASVDSAGALAELLWLGASAFARLGEVALFGRATANRERER